MRDETIWNLNQPAQNFLYNKGAPEADRSLLKAMDRMDW